jgi:hypothetical protein
MNVATEKIQAVEVKVEFPISAHDPYHARYEPTATIGVVRAAAMEHFQAREEPGSQYYLTDDQQHDRRLDDHETVGQVAEEKRELQLTLVKELVQG